MPRSLARLLCLHELCRVQRKIQELGSQIRQAKEALQADLRLAKHLAILTPFRHTTRERVLTAIPPIEKRVRYARIK